MGENRGYVPQTEYKWTDLIKFSGDIPECAMPEDCKIDETSLTYLLQFLLDRECAEVELADLDLSAEITNLTCLSDSNNEIDSPDTITLTTVLLYMIEHECALHEKIAAQQVLIEGLQAQIDELNAP